jgi:hypothetical protein
MGHGASEQFAYRRPRRLTAGAVQRDERGEIELMEIGRIMENEL